MTKPKAKTKTKAKAERDEADRVANLLLLLQASDFRPMASTFYASGNVFATGDPLRDTIMAAVDYEAAPKTGGGMLLAGDSPDSLAIVECERVPQEKLRTLRVLWGTLDTPPAQLCRVKVTTVGQTSGRILSRRDDYRFPPKDGKFSGVGGAWFKFPLTGGVGAELRRRETAGGATSKWATYDHVSTEKVGSGHAASLAPNLLAYTKTLGDICWTVSFAVPGSDVAVRLFTGTDGVAGFYALRDVPEGGRRPALLHWVRAHARAATPPTVTEVRAHFRGKDSFRWFGFDARVHAPATMSSPEDA